MIREHIRDARDEAMEEAHAGELIAETPFSPPCSRDPGAFSPLGFRVRHNDPVEWRKNPPVDEDIPPYSFCTAPYRRMLKDDGGGWNNDPEFQGRRLREFFGALTPKESLVFFYVKDGHPFGEIHQRVIAGAGRISEIGEQLYFPGTPHPVWTRRITHDFEREGVRLPYQEYLNNGKDPSPLACVPPRESIASFSHVAEHVSDDVAVSILERLVQSVQRVRDDAVVPGRWDEALQWLNDALAEVWKSRGLYPGIGSVLEFLGFPQGTTFQRGVLGPRAARGEDILADVLDILDGRKEPPNDWHRDGLLSARELWSKLSKERRALLALLCTLDVSPNQVTRAADPEARKEAGILASTPQILDNPYLLCEQDLSGEDAEPLGLELIDHGLLPAATLAQGAIRRKPISLRDPRRARALVVDVLRMAAHSGHTFLALDEVVHSVRARLPEERACLLDEEIFLADRKFHEEALSLDSHDKLILVSLKHLRKMEEEVAEHLRKLAEKAYPSKGVPWKQLLDGALSEAIVVDSERESRARAEKAVALETMFQSRFCVVTGGAGTGKTTLVKAFLKGLQEVEGRQPVLLLAPTGKARVRLEDIAGESAQTIHEFLMKNEWIHPETYALLSEGGKQVGASVVVIDEASMIPIDVLATLFRSLRMNQVRRLVFVGDPNQLPPIGPGRPLFDIVKWLEAEQGGLRLIKLQEIVRQHEGRSLALQLADAFAGESAPPGFDEVLSLVALGHRGESLEVHYWEDPEGLFELLNQQIEVQILQGFGGKLAEAFDRSLGLGPNGAVQDAEAWQVLAPNRVGPVGTDEVNRRVQRRYRSETIRHAKGKIGGLARPMGDQQIVKGDKIIQTVNERRKNQDSSLRYVANGEVGVVLDSSSRFDTLRIAFTTQKVPFVYQKSDITAGKIELAYGLTVHKAQGSDFDTVFVVLPRESRVMSRELLYAALTRFSRKLVLLVEGDIGPILTYRDLDSSETLRRNTNLFGPLGTPEAGIAPYADGLIHTTATGVRVRSKSEVIVADTLTRLGLDYDYEKRLAVPGIPNDFRLPDFTIQHEGDTFYWEHLGMLRDSSYRGAWEKKREWYEAHGYSDRLITSHDGDDGSIDSEEIERIARQRLFTVRTG